MLLDPDSSQLAETFTGDPLDQIPSWAIVLLAGTTALDFS